MPRPKDPAVRTMLLDRAAAMLRAREPMTLRALVEGTGVSTMAVYTHFGGMDQLWQALRQEGFTRLSARLAEVVATDDAVHDLTGLAVAYLEHALQHPDLYRVMFDDTVDLTDPQGADHALEQLVQAAARAVEVGRFNVDLPPLALATQTWIVGHGLASLVATGPLPQPTLEMAPAMLVGLFVSFGDDEALARDSVARAWRTPGA